MKEQMRCWVMLGAGVLSIMTGCRGHQFSHIISDDQQDLVGSHSAGAATFNPLIDEAVAKLLGRQGAEMEMARPPEGELAAKRICFVGIENQSIEELGDFREQIYEQIDTQILNSSIFQPVSRRFVDAGLLQTRMRPESLFLPENMQLFATVMAQQGQPFDYLLFAKLTSGTTQKNNDTQRDYVLTLELVDVNSGDYDKESAKIRKGYHASRLGKLRNYNIFNRM